MYGIVYDFSACIALLLVCSRLELSLAEKSTIALCISAIMRPHFGALWSLLVFVFQYGFPTLNFHLFGREYIFQAVSSDDEVSFEEEDVETELDEQNGKSESHAS